MPPIYPIPPVLRGKPEVEVWMKLPSDFVERWTKGGSDNIPGMPHYQAGATLIFNSAQIFAWLAKYFGYGGEMKPIAKRPIIDRPRPHIARKAAPKSA